MQPKLPTTWYDAMVISGVPPDFIIAFHTACNTAAVKTKPTKSGVMVTLPFHLNRTEPDLIITLVSLPELQDVPWAF